MKAGNRSCGIKNRLALGASEELTGPNLSMNFEKQDPFGIGKQKSKFIRGSPRLWTETGAL